MAEEEVDCYHNYRDEEKSDSELCRLISVGFSGGESSGYL